MAPLLESGLGWVLVLLDVPLGGIDLFVDVAGWLLIAHGAHRIIWRGRWFEVTRAAAVVAAVVSLRTYVPALAEMRAVTVGESILLTVVVVCLATAMIVALRGTSAVSGVVQLRVVRVGAVVAEVLSVGGLLGRGAGIGDANGVVAVGIITGTVALIWFTLLQLLISARPDLAEYAR